MANIKLVYIRGRRQQKKTTDSKDKWMSYEYRWREYTKGWLRGWKMYVRWKILINHVFLCNVHKDLKDSAILNI